MKSVKERLELELQNSSFEILKGNPYLTLNYHQWRNALLLMVNCENRLLAYDALQSWILFDVENRSSHSFELSNIVKSAVTRQSHAVPASTD